MLLKACASEISQVVIPDASAGGLTCCTTQRSQETFVHLKNEDPFIR
jgi:hypothetical protein